MRRRVRNLVLALSALLLAIGAGFVAWANATPAPMPEALAAMASDSQVDVRVQTWLIFTPAHTPAKAGLILYPGGRVDPRSYAPAAHSVAAQGYLVVIVPMPLNLAVFAPDRALQVIERFPQISAWAIGGHSLGGSMAAHFARVHPDEIRGLILWASYPASSDDLSNQTLVVTSVFGSQDGLATTAKIDASRGLLPAFTRWIRIEGGNHAQFGWYGPQAGDNPATISRREQQQAVVGATVDLMTRVEVTR